jgi:hypothetical protein
MGSGPLARVSSRRMTDRGLPVVDGAPACPFVAFEDDRDERATSPDHRHRCYAEARPAPRALAHQEAYCLSSAFPVCPTFQDWARREAANARRASSGAADPDAAGDEESPRRNPPRDWSAPPPWAGGPAVPGYRSADDDDDPDAPDFLAGRTRPELGLAGSAGDRVAIAGGATPAERDAAAADRRPPDAEDDDDDGSRAAAAGLAAASVAARASVARPAPRTDAAAALDDAVDDYDDFGERVDDRREPDGGDDRAGGSGRDRGPRVGDSRGTRPVPGSAAPSWEQPRRYEAYPTLKTPVGMPAFSRVAVLALLLVLGAAALFLLPGLFLKGSGPGTGGGGSPSPSVAVSGSPVPSVSAAPTPHVYVVAPGDNLGKIAKKFGLTVEQVLAANKQITNADKIAIGDQIVIPSPDASAPEDSAAP